MNTNPSSRKWAVFGVCALLLLIGLYGCATTNGPADPRDPLERYNRAIYKFNAALDRAVTKPVAKRYRQVLPEPFNIAISNFFANLGDISVAVNNLLQLKVVDAASDVGWLAINTTLGIGGLFDVGSGFGLSKHEEDFWPDAGLLGRRIRPLSRAPRLRPQHGSRRARSDS